MLLTDLHFENKKNVKTLFLVDIFHMKNINASYGFKNGDAVLDQLKNLIERIMRDDVNNTLINNFGVNTENKIIKHHSDVLAIIIFADLSETLILKIKEIILNKLNVYQFQISNPNLLIYIDATIGCSKSSNKDLIIYAEKALHNAKQNYTNFLFFDANLYKNETSNNDLVELIKYNIENKMVEPFFQAIHCNKTNKIIKYEALMRIVDKEGNILSPAVFLDKAKSYRLYVPLMQILMNKVLDIISKLKVTISINLDYNDIVNPLISNIITERIQHNNTGKYLTIEIIESERIQDFEMINEFIRHVRKYKTTIAIDDFGTGFSNYDYILKLDIDYLKIDGSLIQKIDTDIYRNLIKSIVSFCKKERIKTVAEFVSDLKIQRYVKSLEIDYSQGFYIQKPMSIKQISGETCE